MKSSPRISLKYSCHQDWDKMTPSKEGRFCDLCSKNVADFRYRSIPEIQHYTKGKEDLCGRFSLEQIEPDLISAEKIFFPVKKLVLIILSFISSEVAGKNLDPDFDTGTKITQTIHQKPLETQDFKDSDFQQSPFRENKIDIESNYTIEKNRKRFRRQLFFSRGFPFIHFRRKKIHYMGRYYHEES